MGSGDARRKSKWKMERKGTELEEKENEGLCQISVRNGCGGQDVILDLTTAKKR